MPRPPVPKDVQTALLVTSRRRCALCFGLHQDQRIKRGQIAHIDGDPQRNSLGNLVWLCLEHHDLYDSRTSQSKGITPDELLHYRQELYAFNGALRASLEQSVNYVALSADALVLAKRLNESSIDGKKFDPQLLIAQLPDTLALPMDMVEVAIDELEEKGLLEMNGSLQFVYPLDRLFWETDPLFAETDPIADAQELARYVVKQSSDFVDLKEIAEGLGWTPRRVNPAATYLVSAGFAQPRTALGSAPFALLSVIRTPRTKRFVRDLDSGQGDAV